MKKVYIAIVSTPDRPDNIVAADTPDNALRAAWLQEQPYKLDFDSTRAGSPSYMRHDIEKSGSKVEVFGLPVHR